MADSMIVEKLHPFAGNLEHEGNGMKWNEIEWNGEEENGVWELTNTQRFLHVDREDCV